MEYFVYFVVLLAIGLVLVGNAVNRTRLILSVCYVILTLFGVFFTYAFYRLMVGKKCRGAFEKIDKSPSGKFECAYYNVDGKILPCMFPAEIVLRDRIYHKGDEVNLLITGKRQYIIDKNAKVTIITGFVSAIILNAVALLIAVLS